MSTDKELYAAARALSRKANHVRWVRDTAGIDQLIERLTRRADALTLAQIQAIRAVLNAHKARS